MLIYSLILVLLTAVITYSITQIETNNGQLAQVETILENNYYKDVDKNALIEGAMHGMAASLDPWTTYMDPNEYSTFNTMMSGSYAGVGLVVSMDTSDNSIVIISTFPDSPAANANLATGDKILKVDGEVVTGDQLDYAVSKMKGEPGTGVTLTVLKKDAADTVDIPITRANITMTSVTGEMKSNGIGYIDISSFDAPTAQEFQDELNTLQSQGMKSLIIDLRDNPGGYVDAAQQIADQFLDSGIIYSISGKHVQSQTFSATSGSLNIPIVILVNENSASAAELLTGALKDNGKATVVGEKTYGKGVMQQLMPLPNGGAIKVTIAQYFTPDGVCIDGIGITPDYIVDGADAQLAKAIDLLK